MIELATVLLIVALLILLNGLFVAAEFAIIGTPKTAVEKDAEKGSRASQKVLSVLTDPRKQDNFIATAQLGITSASLGLGMYGEHALAEWIAMGLESAGWLEGRWLAAHTAASVIAVVTLTYFHIVIGEMVPKSMALQYPRRVAKRVTPFMRAFQWLTLPLVLALNGIGNVLLRLFGIRREARSTEHYRTPEELSYIVNESHTGGKLGKESASVLRELLEFGDLIAGEAMIPRTEIVGIPADADETTIHELIRDHTHTRYIVYEENLDGIIGFVHVKDLLKYLPQGGGLPTEVIRPVPFVPASSSLERVLTAMRKEHSQLTIVMDEHGGTAGIITVEDLFEEVVGEISEDSMAKAEIHRDQQGRIHVSGTSRLDELGEELGLDLEHEQVITVSGLVLDLLERPALVGDIVRWDGIELYVLSVKGRGVGECIVRIIEKPAEESPKPRD